MTESQPPFKKSDVTAEACAWIAQLETRDLTPEDLQAFREWMQRTPRHAAEIKRLARLSHDINVLTEMAGPLEAAADKLRPFSDGRGAGVWIRRSAFAAVLAVMVVVVAGVAWRASRPAPPVGPIMMATAIGDYEDAVLADGTRLQLNSDSQVEVDFTAEERRIRLLKGEAFFEVTSDPSRPFVVYVRENYVWAVGTAFAVRLFENDFEVTVAEGRVALAEKPETVDADEPVAPMAQMTAASDTRLSTTQPIILRAGQTIVLSSLTDAPPVIDISARELQRKLSWQDSLLEFSETPLAEVIREVSRHTTLRIEIVDADLRGLKFGGIFRTGETDALLDALEASYEIEVEYVNDNLVRLRRHKNQ